MNYDFYRRAMKVRLDDVDVNEKMKHRNTETGADDGN